MNLRSLARLHRGAGGLRRRPLAILAAYFVLYSVLTLALASSKVIWSDEFFTLYIAGQPELSSVWEALRSGGDQHPLLFYLIHRPFLLAFGESGLTLRLPSIIGFWLMSICLFAFVARRTCAVYGLAAMLLPWVTIAHGYAIEARGYPLVLGFAGLALLSWQRAGDRPGLGWAAGGLAAGLALAAGAHYYSVFLVPALAVAELVRARRRRRLNPWVWLAFLAPLAVLLPSLPLIASSRSFAATFWAKPAWIGLYDFNRYVFAPAITCLCLCFIALGLYGIWRPTLSRQSRRPHWIPLEEVVAALGLLAIPLMAMVAAKLVTGGFTARYALSAVLGFAILFGFGLSSLLRGRALPGAVVVSIITVWFTASAFLKMARGRQDHAAIDQLSAVLLSRQPPHLPIAIGNSDLFHKLHYYGPPELKRRIVWLADTDASAEYLGHDTPDRSLLALKDWFPLPLRDYRSYIDSHPDMLVYTDLEPNWTWLLSALIDDGRNIEIVERRQNAILLRVRRNAAPCLTVSPPAKLTSSCEPSRSPPPVVW